MVFAVVITHVFLARVPVNGELLAGDLVCDPEISHFHGARALALYGVVGNAGSRGVVTMDGGRWLWVAKFFEDEAYDSAFFGVNEECAEFGFGSRCGNELEDGTDDVNSAIQFDGEFVLR